MQDIIEIKKAPSYLDNVAPDRPDNFDASDVIVPQVRLLQGLSEAIGEFEDANVGDFFHTGMDKSLGDQIRFVICSRRKRYMLLAPRFDGRGVLAVSDDAVTWDRSGSWEVDIDKKTRVTWEIPESRSVAESGLTNWGTFDPEDAQSPPASTLFYDYLVLLPDYPDLGAAVISLSRSMIKRAKKGINDKIEIHRMAGRPMSSILFSARAVDASNDQGQEYKAWSFRQVGFAPEDLFRAAVKVAEATESYSIKDEEVNGEEAF